MAQNDEYCVTDLLTGDGTDDPGPTDDQQKHVHDPQHGQVQEPMLQVRRRPKDQSSDDDGNEEIKQVLQVLHVL